MSIKCFANIHENTALSSVVNFMCLYMLCGCCFVVGMVFVFSVEAACSC